MEESEKQLRAMRTQNALLLQRKQRLQALITKRLMNVSYLKRVHEGGVFWFNCTLLTQADMRMYAHVVVPVSRSVQYLYLALSLSKILDDPDIPRGGPLVRAIAQLLEEWDYYFSGPAIQGVKFVTARTSPCIYPQYSSAARTSATESSPGASPLPPPPSPPVHEADVDADGTSAQYVTFAGRSASPVPPSLPSSHPGNAPTPTPDPTGQEDAFRSRIWKFDNCVVFEHLLTPPLVFDVDYLEVFPVLCAALLDMYEALRHADCHASSLVYDVILKTDMRVKDQVINLIAKEITEMCQNGNRAAVEGLRGDSVPSMSFRSD